MCVGVYVHVYSLVGRRLLLQSNLSAVDHRAGRKRRKVTLIENASAGELMKSTEDRIMYVTSTGTHCCTVSALVCTVAAFQWPTYYIPPIS